MLMGANIKAEDIRNHILALSTTTKIRTKKYGVLEFKCISIDDLEFLQGLQIEDLAAREFTVRFLHHQFVCQPTSLEIVRSWPDKLLRRATTVWVKDNLSLEESIESNMLPFDLLKHRISEHVSEQRRSIQELAQSFEHYMHDTFSDILNPLSDGFRRMFALNIKLTTFDTLPKLVRPFSELGELYRGMDELVSKPLITQLRELTKVKLPEPFLSDTLRLSGINSTFLHSPTYTLPEVQPVRREEEIEKRASNAIQRRLVDSYDILSSLELSLRSLIETKLREIYGERWWKRSIPNNICQECIQRKRSREGLYGADHHPIHYAHLGDFRTIILKGDNWRDAFSVIFGKKSEFEVFFDKVQIVRLDIAHPRPIADLDYLMFTAAAKWLRTAISRAMR